ncbi:MAG: DUF3422 domain-containing protein [Ferrovibrio sp.]|uniref:DUF3422 family protein n=1 Tax=Ferrovibrio sp. TaxID=1917215 RepID=UPI00261DE93D|nr:DUF3422 domain-containing protein [Ferrovibrio sp.]MCW0234527.1 DUF3422 domain-containing protein [Ferrovibrio sp.]
MVGGVGGPLLPDDLRQRAHPLRAALAAEVHARPPLPLAAPARVLHLALLLKPDDAAAEHAHLVTLCRSCDADEPPSGSKHVAVELSGAGHLIWERRTEFSTYTLYLPRAVATPLDRPSHELPLPAGWLDTLPGRLMVAADVTVLGAGEAMPTTVQLETIFDGPAMVASQVASGRATVWTDFHLGADDAVRFVVHGGDLTDAQRGRLVMRLLDIETYRMMALLALPLAQQVAPRITALEQGLAKLSGRMVDVEHESEQSLLLELAGLAAEVETLAVETPYRFGAGRAYHALVERRIAELRETRIEGLPTIGEFMERRLSPAMRTCTTMAERIEGLSRRATRMANLLRTRVDVALERQNVGLLDTMNQRSRLQLRLQETVEGLSVAAITYYVVGLVGYAAQALHAVGLPVDKEIAIGVAIPVVAALVWWGLRRFRRSLQKEGLH